VIFEAQRIAPLYMRDSNPIDLTIVMGVIDSAQKSVTPGNYTIVSITIVSINNRRMYWIFRDFWPIIIAAGHTL